MREYVAKSQSRRRERTRGTLEWSSNFDHPSPDLGLESLDPRGPKCFATRNKDGGTMNR